MDLHRGERHRRDVERVVTAIWPAISATQHAPLQVTTVDGRSTFATDLGPPITAPLTDEMVAAHRFDVVLTGAELSTFQAWFEADLECGAGDFTGLEGLVGDSDGRWQFRTLPVWRVFKGGGQNQRLWRATFDLVKLP
jgi:hypothetical protein